MPELRRAPLIGAKIIWHAMKKLTNARNGGCIKHNVLVAEVASVGHFMDETVVVHVIEDAINDGLLVKSEDGLKIPEPHLSHPVNSSDWYCLECHAGGDVQQCESCPRVFHLSCTKTDAQKQEYWDKLDYHVDKTQNKSLKYKEPELIDPSSIGEHSKLRRYCYGCRLIHKGRAKKTDMSKEELNYLLNFVFNRVHSWINPDTYSLQTDSIPKAAYVMENIDLSIAHLLRFPTTIAFMREKLENQQYMTLEELLRDILDVGHNLALVFGRHSAEFEAANYLFADAQFEIGEIKTCRDCYRHSNEKFDKLWFTLPCASREHELVYAKAPGFCYWPAKVVKVDDDAKYDVRFFGSEHSRAIIPERNIEPIDKNIKRLNNGQRVTSALQQAVNELKEHQKKLELDKDLFTFAAEKAIRDKSKCKFVPNKVEKKETHGKKRKERAMSVSKPMAKKVSNEKAQEMPEKESPKVVISKNSPKRVPVNTVQPNNVRRTSSPGFGPAPKRVKMERERKLMEESQNDVISEPETTSSKEPKNQNPALTKLEDRFSKLLSVDEALNVSKEILKEEIDHYQKKIKKMEAKHQEDIRETKRKQWCKGCYESANYFCCWNTSYCSKECQRNNWDQHRPLCKRKNSS